jgi:hypothetical protein
MHVGGAADDILPLESRHQMTCSGLSCSNKLQPKMFVKNGSKYYSYLALIPSHPFFVPYESSKVALLDPGWGRSIHSAVDGRIENN